MGLVHAGAGSEVAQKYETGFCVFLVILAFLCRENTHLVYPQILYLFVLLLALNLAAGVALRLRHFGEWLSALLVLANCGTITAILSYSGEHESNLWVLYLLPIYTACILLGRREVVWITTGAITFNAAYHAASAPAIDAAAYFALSLKSGLFIFAAASTWRIAIKHREARAELKVQDVQLSQAEISLNLFRRLIDQSNDVILVIAADSGRFLDANATACRVLGHGRTDLVAMEASQIGGLLPPGASWSGFVDGLRERTSLLFECSPQHRDGRQLAVEANVQWVSLENAHYVLVVARDLTERRRMETENETLEAQFLQSQKMESVGRLAGGIAHDFNNLLTAILGFSSLLKGTLKDRPREVDDLDEIMKSANRAAALTQQLLAFSRRQILAPKVLNLNDVVQGTQKMLRRIVSEDIEIGLALDPELRNVRADSSQIEQVILNLTVNGRDAMAEGGRLTIETQNVAFEQDAPGCHDIIPPGRYSMLAVSDAGCGMDKETLTHIFEPFFTTKEQGKGTGLGLSTVYGIVKQSGGYIWVYSEPALGTTFKLYFPNTPEAVAVVSQRPVPRLESLQGHETVLLVEDDAAVRNLLMRVLRQSGYKLLEAHDGEEAIQICAQKGAGIQLVITDVVMPKLGGRRLADHLKGAWPEMKMIFMSGYTDDTIIRQGGLDQDMIFLQKPIAPTTFLTTVRKVLDGIPIAD